MMSLLAWSSIGIAQPAESGGFPQMEPPKDELPLRSLDLSGKLAVGFAEAVGDVRGLSVSLGITSSSFAEIIVGGSWRQPDTRQLESVFGIALGAHIELLQAKDEVVLTLGGRFQLYFSEICQAEAQQCAERNIVSSPTPQYALDLPLRIYWFPHTNFSIHTELGISFTWGEGGASENGYYVNGYQVKMFEERQRLGSLGLTIWF